MSTAPATAKTTPTPVQGEYGYVSASLIDVTRHANQHARWRDCFETLLKSKTEKQLKRVTRKRERERESMFEKISCAKMTVHKPAMEEECESALETVIYLKK